MNARWLFAAISLLLLNTQAGAQNPAFGPAVELDGADDYVWAAPNLSGIPEGTVEMWFRPGSTWGAEALWVGGRGHPGDNYDVGGRLGSHSTAGDYSLSFGIWMGPWMWATSGVFPAVGKSYHVAGTWGSDSVRVYLNGNLLGTNAYTAANRAYNVELIGVSSWADYFHGVLDEVRFWNIQRDSLQIRATMDDTLPAAYTATADSGLMGYYRFDQLEDLGVDGDGADDVRDYSASGNHADTRGGVALVPEGVVVGLSDRDGTVPGSFELSQNVPNPFNAGTEIRYALSRPQRVELVIYNLLGRKVSVMFTGPQAPGSYSLVWDGRLGNGQEASSGVYLYRLVAENQTITRKMLLLR